jgi:predicted acyltransferase
MTTRQRRLVQIPATRVQASAEASEPPDIRQLAGARAPRLLSLDAFRGIAIAAMILVNNPGTWRSVYPPLQHADWNGCTPADLIFPFFLFIVGVAITYSHAPRLARGETGPLLIKIIRRTLIIFALGLLLNGFPYFDWSIFRIPGVLQRIALCYLVAALIAIAAGIRGQAVISALLIIGYGLAMKYWPVHGHPTGGLAAGKNLAAYLDNALLHGHMLHRRWDPEGLLSTVSATATTLLGVLTGHWLRSSRSPYERLSGLFVAGNLGLVLGLAMNAWFPINKSLWSSSYVLFTAGVALDFLGLCYFLIDIKEYRKWAKPFIIYGTNPIAAYMLSSLMAKGMALHRVARSTGGKVVLQRYVFEGFFLHLANPKTASLLYALAYVLLWLAIAALLYRKRIFIRV